MFTFAPQIIVMQEFILTLVVIFVLFKVFGRPTVINFNQHNHQKPDGKIKVTASNNKKNQANDDGEYVDYEEIK
jgi:uncharacterized membrane protein